MQAIEVSSGGIMALIATMSFGQRWQLVRNVTKGKWNKARKMGIPGEGDGKYLLIQVADHKNHYTLCTHQVAILANKAAPVSAAAAEA